LIDDDKYRRSPPRTNGTPSGYRNIRVLVHRDLHYRLLAYASQSHLSLAEFVVDCLNRAGPLEPPSYPPGDQEVDGPAPTPPPPR
jgi:hypothetical protein